MRAREKMDALGLKALHEMICRHRPGTALETLYRWRQALSAGRGIPDQRKKLLIEATRETPHPIHWEDFDPVRELC